jgi:hypothetical protein
VWSGERFVREAGRGLVVPDVAAYGAGVLPAVDAPDEPQRRVGPGGHALAGDDLAVDDVPSISYDGDFATGGEVVLDRVVASMKGRGLPPSGSMRHVD